MTLSTRNRLMVAGFAGSLPALIFLAFTMPLLFRATAGILSAQRATGLVQLLVSWLLDASPSAALVGIILCVLLALGLLAGLYYSFEKTQTPEILFIALFAFSFSFEALRAAVPLALVGTWPKALLVGTLRIVVIARFSGLFSLFTASLYAGGLNYQKPGRVILIVVLVASMVSNSLALDDLSFDTSFMLVPGYNNVVLIMEWSCLLMTAAGFAAAAYQRNSADYLMAAAGCLVVSLGRDALLHADAWLIVFIGWAILAAGSWLLCASLHRHHLWL